MWIDKSTVLELKIQIAIPFDTSGVCAIQSSAASGWDVLGVTVGQISEILHQFRVRNTQLPRRRRAFGVQVKPTLDVNSFAPGWSTK